MSRPRTRDHEFDGMIPFIDFTNAFLDSLADWNWKSLIAENQITNKSELYALFMEKKHELIWWRFVFCVALGIFSIVIFPFWGLCFCCCTCCGCCCCRTSCGKDPLKREGCPLQSLISTLSISGIFMLVSSMMCISCLEIIRAETSVSGTPADLLKAINETERYTVQMFDDIEDTIYPRAPNIVTSVQAMVSDVGVFVATAIEDKTKLNPVIHQFKNYSDALPTLKTNYENMARIRVDLIGKRTALEASLSASRARLSTFTRTTCASSDVSRDCVQLNPSIARLTPRAQFAQLSDTAPTAVAVQAVVAGGFTQTFNAAYSQYEQTQAGLSAAIKQQTQGPMNQALGFIQDDLNQTLVQTRLKVLRGMNFSFWERFTVGIQGDLENYSHQALDVTYFTNTLAVGFAGVIVSALVLGLFGGDFCRKLAVKLLCGSVFFLCFFGVCFWVMTLIFFIPGGIMRLLFCRHIVTYDASAQALENVTRFDNFSTTYKHVQVSCQKNKAAFTALNLKDNGLDVREVINLKETQRILDEAVTSINYNPTFTLYNPSAVGGFTALQQQIDAVDLDAYIRQCNTPIMNQDITAFNRKLNAIHSKTNNPAIKTEVTSIISELSNIETTQVEVMERDQRNLLTATNSAKKITSQGNLARMYETLGDAERALKNDPTILQKSAKDGLEPMLTFLNTNIDALIEDLESEIGKCRPLYDAFQYMFTGPCWYLLEPVNVYACSFGWYMTCVYVMLVCAPRLMSHLKAMGDGQTQDVVPQGQDGFPQEQDGFPQGQDGVPQMQQVSPGAPATSPQGYPLQSPTDVYSYDGIQSPEQQYPPSPGEPPGYAQGPVGTPVQPPPQTTSPIGFEEHAPASVQGPSQSWRTSSPNSGTAV